MVRAGVALALALAVLAFAGPAPAQVALASPFLIINQERLLTGSRMGQEILAEEERQRDALRAEARALDASFEAEERQLTEQRRTRKFGDALAAAASEELMTFVTSVTDEITLVFHDAHDRDPDLLAHGNGLVDVLQCNFLRCGHDDCAVTLDAL